MVSSFECLLHASATMVKIVKLKTTGAISNGRWDHVFELKRYSDGTGRCIGG